jgi:hypothetical protein
MFIVSRTFPLGRLLAAVFALSLALAMPGIVAASSGADEDASIEDTKDDWQSEYRGLLINKARVQRNLEAARTSYSKSRRRNYPRGAAREQFLIDAATAEKELVELDREIDQFKTKSRRQGILPGWFFEVEEGPLDAPQPAAPAEEDPEDREGRNPLYLDSE